MAPRDSSKTSTVLSKTTSKVIMKRSLGVVTLSSGEKAEALAKKTEAMEDARRKREALAPSDQANEALPPQGVSYASTLGSTFDKNAGASAHAVGRPEEAQKRAPKKTIWPVPASNTEYQKLTRPGVSTSGASALGGLQISGRSTLQQISGNVPSQGSVVAKRPRPTDKVHSPRDFQVGVVFSTATHQRDYTETLQPGNTNQSMTGFGVVYSKYRKFVVLARFKTHVLALPIYTHEGRGLANKAKDEYVSIRDVDQGDQAAAAESVHDVIWAERYPMFKSPQVTSWHMMSNATSIHLTAPYSHPMGLKCTISGKLKPSSIDYLLKLFGEITSAALSNDSLAKPAPAAPDADGFLTVAQLQLYEGETHTSHPTLTHHKDN